MLFAKKARRVKRILIVEDEPLVAFDTEHQLTDAGYIVTGTVDSVDEALAAIRQGRIDLVLVDLGLIDGGNGVEVAAAARREGMHVLFVTGRCPKGAESLGIGCLEKPYGVKDLKASLEAVNALLAGTPVKKLPPGLTLYQATAA
jgi:two-component system, response regulator PdtaR